MSDFTVYDCGTVVQIVPRNKKALSFLCENVDVSDDWQWLGNTLCVDHRYAGGLVEFLADGGFSL